MKRIFVTATGTGIGKTFLTRGLAAALARAGRRVAAIKPVETGCNPQPSDAVALALACRSPHLAAAPGLYRARAPLAPYAATLAGEAPPPTASELAQATLAAAEQVDYLLVEGAGGPLVPLSSTESMLDLATALGSSVVLVGRDELGVISHLRCAAEAILQRRLSIAAIVLVTPPDPVTPHNGRVLRDLGYATCAMPWCADDDDALAGAVTSVLPALL